MNLIPIWYFMRSKKAIREIKDGDIWYVIAMFLILLIVFIVFTFFIPWWEA
jgi:quinol-cytochrome oxidoreductase complex cytochrome b subunit